MSTFLTFINKNQYVVAVAVVAATVIMAGTTLFFIKDSPLVKKITNKVPADKVFTLSEVALHTVGTDCWVAYQGRVYDVSWFVAKHKGGNLILTMCGQDATSFSSQHPGGSFSTPQIQAVLQMSDIGQLVRSK